jgi:integrase
LACLWRSTEQIGWPFGAVYQMLILTGCRLNEVARLQWAEIDGDTLKLPADRTKTNKPHDVPLSTMARSILDAAPRIAGSPYVFTTSGRAPVSGFSKAKSRLDQLMPSMLPWRTHDIRRSVATGLQRIGTSLPVIEKILGHESGSYRGVVGVYQRHAFSEEKREALEKWSAHVEKMICGGSK